MTVTDAIEESMDKKRTHKYFTQEQVGKNKNPNGKMVILVVDEARSLLAGVEGRMTKLKMLRRALKLVNKELGSEGGIFGVLVDTNVKIAGPTTSRLNSPDKKVYFPPFVLTHTVDVMWREYYKKKMKTLEHADEEKKEDDDDMTESDRTHRLLEGKEEVDEIAMYRAAVTGIWGKRAAWEALQHMGRPMWVNTIFMPGKIYRGGLLNLAANKLMMGCKPAYRCNYNEDTMFGVASMLCRLGIRPRSSSALAPLAVVNFMAILSYVKFESDGYVCSYASDPMLTLGAIKVWHQWKESLAEYILPQLRKLLLDEVLDTGGIGELVARIVLLLAMDKCVLGEKHVTNCELTGQFVSVEAFLDVLGGSDMVVFDKSMTCADDDQEAFSTWKSQWIDWCVGFTHFLQLELPPNEDTLWYLLGRRAAGIFPCDQNGVDLLIPIFEKNTKEEWQKKIDERSTLEGVSLMLIRVKNRSPTDSDFSKSASTELCPWFVFGGEDFDEVSSSEEELAVEDSISDKKVLNVNPLSKKSVHEVIRIYMNMNEAAEGDQFRFIYSTPIADNRPKEKTTPHNTEGVHPNISSDNGERVFTFCFRSVCPKSYPFVDKQVARQLTSMVESSWDPIVLVDGDLERRDAAEEYLQGMAFVSEVITSAELKEVAAQGLSSTFGHAKDIAKQDLDVDRPLKRSKR